MSINIARIVELAETIEVDEETDAVYTSFAIAKVINETFAALGVDLVIDSQYTYNDSRNGKINGVKSVKGGKTRYTKDEVELYVAKFVASRVRGTKVLAEQPEQESVETELPPADVDVEDDEQELRELSELENENNSTKE